VVNFSKFVLDNGLRVIIHPDESTPMVAVNVLYNVGARDESPDKTGLAHLFEHLMFGGSENIEDFDDPIQRAGGENNAFTNNDITNFYDIIPAQNLEVALWLESDRMLSLNFDEEVLEVQRKVVIEEFKESCLNPPTAMSGTTLPIWPIRCIPTNGRPSGKYPKHVEDATLADVKDFYQKFYNPNNAILTLAGNVSLKEGRRLAEKWFGDIPRGINPVRRLPQEPPQKKLQQRINQAKVPVDALYLAFHSPGRSEADFYVSDILSDILGNGSSARLYRKLLKEKQVVNQIDCYVTGSMDPGLFIIEARPAEGVSLEEVEQHIWTELSLIRHELVSERELQKLKNKIESTLLFSEMSVLNKAMNLAFFELLGDADIINEEADMYHRITRDQVRDMARKIFTPENCCELYYKVQ
jgi:zinc protease